MIKGLQQDIRQSENFHVDECDWLDDAFNEYVRDQVKMLIRLLKEGYVESSEWNTWREVPDWEVTKLPDHPDVRLEEAEGSTGPVSDHNSFRAFREIVDNLVSKRHKTQLAVPSRQTPKEKQRIERSSALVFKFTRQSYRLTPIFKETREQIRQEQSSKHLTVDE